MIVEKKGTGEKSDGIRADLPETVSWVKIRDIDENYIEVRVIDQKSQSEYLKQEIISEHNQQIDEIADLIESGLRGKELADEIRKLKK